MYVYVRERERGRKGVIERVCYPRPLQFCLSLFSLLGPTTVDGVAVDIGSVKFVHCLHGRIVI